MEKYILIYPRILSESEQTKVIRLTSASKYEYICSHASPNDFIITVLTECNYDLIRNKSSAMIIETNSETIFLSLDLNIKPHIMLAYSDELLNKIRSWSELINLMLKYENHLYETASAIKDYADLYDNIFGEETDMVDLDFESHKKLIFDERCGLICKIEDEIEEYIIKQ